MEEIMNIIVLYGGLSPERDVSRSSGTMAYNALKRLGHNAVMMDLFFGYTHPYEKPEDVFSQNAQEAAAAIGESAPDLKALIASRGNGRASRIGDNVVEICRAADLVFLALHGADGEDGKIQALFDLEGIRYTGSGSLASAMAMNKGVAKELFAHNGIRTPAGIVVKKGCEPYDNVGFPCVVKPRSGGSSVGTSVVFEQKDYLPALELAFESEEHAIVEQYIKGRETDVGVMDGKALPPIEICPKSGFYDYKNKYQANMTDEYCPADFPPEITQRLQQAAVNAYNALMLEVYGRMDFIVDEQGQVWCLVANTLPGLTPMSLMPQEAAAAGMDYDAFIAAIVEKSMEKYDQN
jgi:D-alanine-D-alanine ligase